MILKNINDIEKEDLQALVDSQRQEEQTLDYKQTIPKSNEEINEFLKDVSAFANAAGGDIILGIAEEKDENGKNTGKPAEILGLENINIDQAKLTLLNHIADKIAPKVMATIRHVDGFSKGSVLIIRVRKSWRPPHMILPNKNPRFYTRDNNGNRPLDIEQIRHAFLQSENLEEKIKNIRDGRLARVISGETPVPLLNNPAKLVLHIVPLEALNSSFQIDLNMIANQHGADVIRPIGVRSFCGDGRYNYEGYLTHSIVSENENNAYFQMLRNGVIETVSTSMTHFEEKTFPIIYVQHQIIECLKKYLNLLKLALVQPPYVVFISFIDVKGFRFDIQGAFYHDTHSNEIGCNDLLLPDILIETSGENIVKKLIPAFDVIWQAAGLEKSKDYDESINNLKDWDV